ncbi:MAG: hypothetical protein M1326_02390 [Cyanobacteria bacterium]|nr:hypothetical protein [Cyanobacteriota bacterium]
MILSILRIIPALASFFFIGYPFSYLLLIKSGNVASEFEAYHRYRIVYGRILLAVISFYIGALISSLFLIIISLLGLNFNLLQPVVLSAVFFIYSIILMVKYKRRLLKVSGFFYTKIENVNFLSKLTKRKYREQTYEQLQLNKPPLSSRILSLKNNLKIRQKISHILNPLLITLIIINILIVVFFAILFPIRFWDAISCWSLKAKAFFIDKNMVDFYLKHDYTFSAISYPPFLSLIQTWIYLWIGKIDENIVKIIFPLFYTSLVFLIFSFFKKKFSETLSLLLAFIFGAVPLIADHGYIEYSNLLFSIILFIAVYFFWGFISIEMSEINNFTQKKKNIIEKVQIYIYEYKNSITLDFKIHDSIESVFKNSQTQNSYLNERLDENLNYYNKDKGNKGKYNNNDKNKNKDMDIEKEIEKEKDKNKSIYRLRKYSHLYLSTVFFGILLLTRSEGIFYCALFLLIDIAFYFYRLFKRAILKNKFQKVLVNINDPFYSNKNKEWWKNINAKFISNESLPLVNIKLFFKKIILPVVLLFIIYLPWLLFKLKLNLPFISEEWQKVLKSSVNSDFILTGLKRAFLSFTAEFVYSSYDSTKAFFGSFYGPVLIILLILFFVSIKNAFKNEGFVFFLFVILVLVLCFISITFVVQFEGSIERYIMPAFPIAYYWILTSAFKTKA